jgi:glycerol-3-phosphate dehydrogenase
LLEKEADIAEGASSANSGIIHAGYDAEPGSLKARFNTAGNAMMDRLSDELGIPFKRLGSLVLAFSPEDMVKIAALYERGLRNGVGGMEVLSGEQVRQMEPEIATEVVGALYASSAGITCPYEMTAAAVENAVDNGVELRLGYEVKGIRCAHPDSSGYRFIIETRQGDIFSRFVVNAAGIYSDSIAAMVGDFSFSIKPRKGEYLLLDKNQGSLVSRVIFQAPSELGKGVLVSQTVDGNLLLGPNAVDVDDKEDRTTSTEGLKAVVKGAVRSVPRADIRNVITSFAGLRAVPSTGDFIISESYAQPGFFNAAGIESPGLTSAPAIGVYMAEVMSAAGLKLRERDGFKPRRAPVKRFVDMDEDEINRLLAMDRSYGRIICRCEKVTEGEIVAAIRRPAGARSLDGIKRRTRAGMGRCQGGFCTPRVVEILSREIGLSPEEVTKFGGSSWVLSGRTKQGRGQL